MVVGQSHLTANIRRIRKCIQEPALRIQLHTRTQRQHDFASTHIAARIPPAPPPCATAGRPSRAPQTSVQSSAASQPAPPPSAGRGRHTASPAHARRSVARIRARWPRRSARIGFVIERLQRNTVQVQPKASNRPPNRTTSETHKKRKETIRTQLQCVSESAPACRSSSSRFGLGVRD